MPYILNRHKESALQPNFYATRCGATAQPFNTTLMIQSR
jgi:hypothetical protein